MVTNHVNILIADDHAVVRTGLRALLDWQERFRVVAEAETGEESHRASQKAQARYCDHGHPYAGHLRH